MNVKETLIATTALASMMSVNVADAFAQSGLPGTSNESQVQSFVQQLTKPTLDRKYQGYVKQDGAYVSVNCGLVKAFNIPIKGTPHEKTLYTVVPILDDVRRSNNIFPLSNMNNKFAQENINDASDTLVNSGVSMKQFINGGVSPSTVDRFEIQFENQCHTPQSSSSQQTTVDVPGTTPPTSPPPEPSPGDLPGGCCGSITEQFIKETTGIDIEVIKTAELPEHLKAALAQPARQFTMG